MSKMTGSKGRGRNRNNSGKRPQGRGGNFDSGGRNRGNAQQLLDKYTAMARDATQQGDRIAAENYYQHADHYYRVVNARNEQQEARRRTHNGNENNNATDPIPAQNRGQEQGKGQDARQGSEERPVDVVTNQEVANKSTPAESNASSSEVVSPNIGTHSAPVEVQTESVQDAPPVKKPRRGRPPKKAAEPSSEAPAPEAAE